MTLTTFALLTLLAAREPLPIPGWSPPRPTAPARASTPTPVAAEAPPPPLVQATDETPGVADEQVVPDGPRPRSVALTFGLGALVLSPSLELEVAPWRHVSLYVGGELSALRLGAGGQAGVRLRPLEWLQGPFLDVHVRFARYAGLLLGPGVEETANPGVMLGFSWVSEGGFVITGGLGVNLFAKTTTTEVRASLASATSFPVPRIELTQHTRIGPALETRLAIGYAF
ncbi:MAG: hypothetical protein JNJ54_21505 [Myxococcaceae bacterium]|nr:hypothetical protein [Myxococcaceae bacterium]